MAVDINEYRKERIKRAEEEAKKLAETPALVEQSAVDESKLTGNGVLDKLLRALQPLVTQLDANVKDSAMKGIRAPAENIFREIQFQHAYMSGKLDMLAELSQIAQVVAHEEKKNTVILPS